MPYNGSGQFELVSGNPVVTGTVISSSWANNTLNDIANNGLSNALTKDGQQTPTANIKLGGFRLTGLGDAVDDTDAVTFGQAKDATHLPAGYRNGGTLTTPSTASISIAPGSWRDTTDAADIVLTTAMVKTMQTVGTWVAGQNGNGIFPAPVVASTWYHVFIIRNPDTGAVDAGLDTSPIAANRPAAFTQFRRIGAVLTTATKTITPFIQSGNEFRWSVPVVNLAAGNPGLTRQLLVVTVPPGVVCRAKLQASLIGATGDPRGFCVYCPDESDARQWIQVPNTPSTQALGFISAVVIVSDGSSQSSGTGVALVCTNTARQVAYISLTNGNTPLGNSSYIGTLSYFDFIGD